jgi:hypothetical protein
LLKGINPITSKLSIFFPPPSGKGFFRYLLSLGDRVAIAGKGQAGSFGSFRIADLQRSS